MLKNKIENSLQSPQEMYEELLKLINDLKIRDGKENELLQNLQELVTKQNFKEAMSLFEENAVKFSEYGENDFKSLKSLLGAKTEFVSPESAESVYDFITRNNESALKSGNFSVLGLIRDALDGEEKHWELKAKMASARLSNIINELYEATKDEKIANNPIIDEFSKRSRLHAQIVKNRFDEILNNEEYERMENEEMNGPEHLKRVN